MTLHTNLLAPAILLAALALPAAASAHGNVRCNGGPEASWKPVETLKAQLVKDGWTVQKAKKTRDCYEVYGIMPDGKKVESFWHPVTLEKVQILQRGKVIFPAG
jgi:hypothetical protein